jgi:BASS family bile acid:Na+ symporter
VFAVSIVLLCAAPGGTTSNLVVHAADVDRALSVTLTALSNSVVWLTMPFLLDLGFRTFDDRGVAIDFPVGEVMLQVAALTIVPVIIGMAIRNRAPDWSARTADRSKVLAGGFLAVVIVVLVVQEFDLVVSDGPRFAPAFIALNAAALAVGYGAARLARIDGNQALTISIETGLQNSTLAITIAISVLDDGQLAIIPGLYGVWMLATGFAFALYMARRQQAGAPAHA